MAESLDQDIYTLKEWIRGAWRQLADPALTSFDRREIRNYMKEAEVALHAGLGRSANQQRAGREAEKIVLAEPRLNFRILKLDA